MPYLRRSIAAAVNKLSAERRRSALTENQVRAMIGGGAKKPVLAPPEMHEVVGVLYLTDGRELPLFLQGMCPVPQGSV
jgi:hypothetical protein